MKKKALQVIDKERALQEIDPVAIQQIMEEKMPAWVKEINNKEDMGNAVLATSQEMLLVVMDTLARYHGFKDKDLKKFAQEIEDVLKGVKEFEESGLNILSAHSVAQVGERVEKVGIDGLLQEIAEVRLRKEKMTRAGKEYPASLANTPFIKRLKGKK